MIFDEIQLQNKIFMILGGPWPARAGNLDIPIGILRFLSLPGPLRSLQNRVNHKISFEIAFSNPKQVFPPLDLKKWPQNVTFIKGFWQGPPMSIFAPPDAFLEPKSIKGCIL